MHSHLWPGRERMRGGLKRGGSCFDTLAIAEGKYCSACLCRLRIRIMDYYQIKSSAVPDGALDLAVVIELLVNHCFNTARYVIPQCNYRYRPCLLMGIYLTKNQLCHS